MVSINFVTIKDKYASPPTPPPPPPVQSVLEITLAQERYQVVESSGEIEVEVCKEQQISSTVTLIVSALTIDDAIMDELFLPFIPLDDPYSPNRAG